ncbi:sensor histidine kinase [Pseudomonadota bacterium]
MNLSQLISGAGNRRWILRRTLLFFLPPALLTLALLSYLYVNERDANLQSLALSEQRNVDMTAAIVTTELSKTAEDLQMARKLVERMLPHANHSPEMNGVETLGKHFSDLSDITRKYDQVRLLDVSGMETIRINLVDGHAISVPGDKLQNKAGRYYFTAIIEMQPDAIYVSPLDLNVEHGQIEFPLKPVLRLGSKVTASDGRTMGAVILNLLGSTLFEAVHDHRFESNVSIMIVNAEGYWLHNHDAEGREWGFMMNRPHDRFQIDFPDAWKGTQEKERGQFSTPSGFVTFATISPTQTINDMVNGGMPHDALATPHDDFWKIISVVPRAQLDAYDAALVQRLSLMAITTLTLFAVIAYFFAQTQSMRQEVAKRIERLETQESLGQLANSVAHEFNNLLVPIRALSEMVMNDLPHDSSGRRRLEKVLEASLRAKNLVEGILVFGKGGGDEFGSCDITDTIAANMSLIRDTLPATVTLLEHYADNLRPANCSERQVRNILVNLVSNARDALQGHVGTITINLDMAEPPASLSRAMNLERGIEYIRLTVKDDGCGMDEKTLRQALDPFFTTKNVGEGHGLGLYQVNMLVTAAGGGLTIDSAPNVGTAATVWIPTEMKDVD